MNLKTKDTLKLCVNIKAHLIFLVFLSSMILFYDLGNRSLIALDEAKWAQIASEMIKSGDLLTPRIGGRVYRHKPPFRMWLNTIAFYFLGENEFAIRFWSAISGVGIIILTYLLSYLLYKNLLVALTSSLILIFSPLFVFEYLRIGHEHCTFTFFSLLCLVFFWLSRKNQNCLYLSSLFFCFAFLTYNFAAIFVPLVMLTYLIISKEIKKYSLKVILNCLLISAFIILPWYIFQYIHNEINFFKIFLAEVAYYFNANLIKGNNSFINFVGKDLTNNMLNCLDVTSFRGPMFYINVIKLGFYPWWISLLVYLVFINFNNFIKICKKIKIRVRNEDLFMIIWFICILCILLVFKDKTPWRIYFMFPAFSILTTKSFQWFCRNNNIITAILILGITALLIFNLHGLQLCILDQNNVLMELDLIISSGKTLFDCKYSSYNNLFSTILKFILFSLFVFILIFNCISYRHRRNTFHYIICLFLFIILFSVGIDNTINFFPFSKSKSDIDLIVGQIKQLNYHVKKLVIYDDILYKMENGVIIPEYSVGGVKGLFGGHRWDTYYYIHRLDFARKYIKEPKELSVILKDNKDNVFLINIQNWSKLKEMKWDSSFNVLIAKGEYVLAILR